MYILCCIFLGSYLWFLWSLGMSW